MIPMMSSAMAAMPGLSWKFPVATPKESRSFHWRNHHWVHLKVVIWAFVFTIFRQKHISIIVGYIISHEFPPKKKHVTTRKPFWHPSRYPSLLTSCWFNPIFFIWSPLVAGSHWRYPILLTISCYIPIKKVRTIIVTLSIAHEKSPRFFWWTMPGIIHIQLGMIPPTQRWLVG